LNQEIIVVARVGRLDVVATPIGNLGDLSPRAREALSSADVVAAEDTRRTQQLLNAMGIARPLRSLHAHNEHASSENLLTRLLAGDTVALVSDAGTPLLSDPGGELVQRAAAAGIEVRAVPGPSAIAAALMVAGLSTERFCFEGFLPARGAARRERLAELAYEPRTLVFFEAPHRIGEALEDLAAAFGEARAAAVTREITKLHESVYRGSLSELRQRAASDADMARGEITIVVAGHVAAQGEDSAEVQALLQRALRILLAELPPSRAAAIAAQIAGVKRNEAYQVARRMTHGDST
jgi:16S rRNA (cytidine1402-2'-O)-methyltransferase